MANPDHIEVLAQGVEAWNAWREENENILPDLSAADLSEKQLSGINFWAANLKGTNCTGADLTHANLAGADMTEAVLCYANLNGADLLCTNFESADLRQAELTYANVARAKMAGAIRFEGNREHLEILGKGVEEWNQWREDNPDVVPDLTGVNLHQIYLQNYNFSGANLTRANFGESFLCATDFTDANLEGALLAKAQLPGAKLHRANLARAWLTEAALSLADFSGANFTEATLHQAECIETRFIGASFEGADLWGADCTQADFSGANLANTNLFHGNFFDANFTGANLSGANLDRASLSEANLSDADLSGASLQVTTLVQANMSGASLSGACVYGISAWGLNLDQVKDQANLLITPAGEAAVTVDNLEMAQFTYLLLNNARIRNVIDTVAQKGVLILGRFTPERKAVLDAIRERLRQLGFVPIMFDFEGARSKDFTETVKILGGMSRFIIADITMPKSSPLELQSTVPEFMIPFVPIIWEGEEPFSMFCNLQNKYDWVLDVLEYRDAEQLAAVLEKAIVEPAIAKEAELLPRKNEQARKRRAEDYV